jgi:DNA-binding NarL/FixJ family response regulator
MRDLNPEVGSLKLDATFQRQLSADPEDERLHHEARELARQLEAIWSPQSSSPSGQRTVRTPKATYRLRASVVVDHGTTARRAILVEIERVTPELPSLPRLGERFQLTPREAMVAWLLTLGRSNAAIATELGITERTARAHTEKVLCKLGVNSRAEVGFLVLTTASDR